VLASASGQRHLHRALRGSPTTDEPELVVSGHEARLLPIPSATSMKSKLTFLETVYPPVSNQEAVWLQNDPEVELNRAGFPGGSRS
jgi:hypothetical protein